MKHLQCRGSNSDDFFVKYRFSEFIKGSNLEEGKCTFCGRILRLKNMEPKSRFISLFTLRPHKDLKLGDETRIWTKEFAINYLRDKEDLKLRRKQRLEEDRAQKREWTRSIANRVKKLNLFQDELRLVTMLKEVNYENKTNASSEKDTESVLPSGKRIIILD